MKIDFKVSESNILNGVYIIKPSIFIDERGFIWTSFLNKLNELLDKNLYFKHDKISYSKKNVLRGIHGDSKTWKLVTCVYGEILQVVVDRRKKSPTYNKWEKFVISYKEPMLILIPPQMGNAFFVRSEESVYLYKLAYEGNYADYNEQFTISWDDKEINIDWENIKPILSDRDMKIYLNKGK